MIIYPAIDLRGGKVVRLREGDPGRQTIYSDNPVETARRWIDDGAQWIHMVNLDGAFAQANDNGAILEAVAKFGVPVQFGGGLRSQNDITYALERGASRVVLGTVAIQQPEIVTQAVEAHSAERICVGLDAKDGKIAIKGWQETADLTPIELGQQMAARGARHALYTDVNRDGGLSGANVEATAQLAIATGLHVIASGGVTTAGEIRELARRGVAGAVIGMALYEGKLTLKAALGAAQEG
jgi:phosphoribosylformimino-5-aminoimidazole carboxamide ribotide isomerase